MEEKIRAESHKVIEKAFNRTERRGSIAPDEVKKLITEMQPGWEINASELEQEIANAERSGTGKVDWGGFNKVAMHFFMKQSKQLQDQFIHKHEVGSSDFEAPPNKLE
ncbi:uncharacterized protein LOC110862784 [Folsomia candida]|uniref:Uncharacterized protein n=1 Tax=Folsomia candida TaxID=158441 RepID=A0A226CU44_FOLCA|nr:uncharacterized protein LOC110862784 [Folsomia candida]OXA36952.1 hypothetical protein Fcan01_28319 [Folsomia candida]